MILQSLKQLFTPEPLKEEAHRAYVALVNQSRKPWFYQSQRVADTVDGRFDVIVVHMFLLMHRLEAEQSEEAGQFSRALAEVFFADMDRSLREMGSTDTGVGMRVKKMAQAFYGRIKHYEESLEDIDALKACIVRNLYRGSDPGEDAVQAVAAYISRNIISLREQPAMSLLGGIVVFLD